MKSRTLLLPFRTITLDKVSANLIELGVIEYILQFDTAEQVLP